MNSNQISCFLEGASCRNFTEAASRLFISQPAFSRNISTLEDELGFPLFYRDKRKETKLTPAGELMYEELKKMSKNYADVVERARDLHLGKKGKLVVGFMETEYLSPEISRGIKIMDKKYPEIELIFKMGSYRELTDWLADGTVDVIITLHFDIKNKAWIDNVTLYSCESVLILQESFTLKEKDMYSLADFKDSTFIGVNFSDSEPIFNLLIMECKKAGFEPKMVLAPDIRTQMLWVRAGKGIAITSLNNMLGHNSQFKVVKVGDLLPMSFAAGWRRGEKTAVISCFLNCIKIPGA